MIKEKELFKEKSFQINPNVLKNIKKQNLSLNEFLLILYFINIEPSLNLEEIKKYLNFTNEEILNIYSDLLTKGMIEIQVIKENGALTEKISLEMFYDKLILNKPKEDRSEERRVGKECRL